MIIRLPVYIVVNHPINPDSPIYWVTNSHPGSVSGSKVYRVEIQIDEPMLIEVPAGKVEEAPDATD